jgi:hypothetical protein
MLPIVTIMKSCDQWSSITKLLALAHLDRWDMGLRFRQWSFKLLEAVMSRRGGRKKTGSSNHRHSAFLELP